MTDLKISISDFSVISKEKIDFTKVKENSSTSDNILDISDPENSINEINNQDIDKIKYLKASGGKYIDLSDPVTRNKIINDLKSSFKDSNRVFSSAKFENNTGVILSVSENTELKEVKKEVNSESLDKTVSEIFSSVSKDLDITHNMSQNEYNSYFNGSDSVFSNIISNLDKSENKIDTLLKQNLSEEDKIKLNNAKKLIHSIKNLYSELKNNKNNVKLFFSDINKVVDNLESSGVNLQPNILSKIKLSLLEVNTIVSFFGTLKSNNVKFESIPSDLNKFTIVSYHRLQQILGIAKDGNRDRKSETKNIEGALSSFQNDMSDMQEFMKKISILNADLNKGKFSSKEAFIGAMQKAVKGTSIEFRSSIQNLANAFYNLKIARDEIQKANKATIQAEKTSSEAGKKLAESAKEVNESVEQSNYSESINNIDDARNAIKIAQGHNDNAKSCMEKYEELSKKALGFSDEAIQWKNKALASANEAQKYNNLVKKSNYSSNLKSQTDSVNSSIISIKSQAKSIESRIGAVRSNIEKNNDFAKQLSVAIDSQSDNLKARNIVINQIEASREKIRSLSSKCKDMPQDVRKYLDNPGSIPQEEQEQVKIKLLSYLSSNPSIAIELSKELSSSAEQMKEKFNILKAQYKDNPEKIKFINSLEFTAINEWMNKSGGLVSILSEVGKNYSSGEIESTGQAGVDTGLRQMKREEDEKNRSQITSPLSSINSWLNDTAKTNGIDILGNSESVKIYDQIEEQMKCNPEMDAKYQQMKSDFEGREPDSKIQMMIINDQGVQIPFVAYVYNKDGKSIIVNPMDNSSSTREYSGNTPEEAMSALVNDNKMSFKGNIIYRLPDGNIKNSLIVPPTDFSTADTVMGAAGLVGGIASLIPGGQVVGVPLLIASSAYFLYRGSTEMYDLSKHNQVGWNKDTGMAALDIASGLLGVIDGIGAVAQIAKGSQVAKGGLQIANQTTKVLTKAEAAKETIMRTLRVVTQGKTALFEGEKSLNMLEKGTNLALKTANYSSMGAGLAIPAEKLYKMSQTLTKKDFIKEAAKVILTEVTPQLLPFLIHIGMNKYNKVITERANKTYNNNLDLIETALHNFKPEEIKSVSGEFNKSLHEVKENYIKTINSSKSTIKIEEAKLTLSRIEKIENEIQSSILPISSVKNTNSEVANLGNNKPNLKPNEINSSEKEFKILSYDSKYDRAEILIPIEKTQSISGERILGINPTFDGSINPKNLEIGTTIKDKYGKDWTVTKKDSNSISFSGTSQETLNAQELANFVRANSNSQEKQFATTKDGKEWQILEPTNESNLFVLQRLETLNASFENGKLSNVKDEFNSEKTNFFREDIDFISLKKGDKVKDIAGNDWEVMSKGDGFNEITLSRTESKIISKNELSQAKKSVLVSKEPNFSFSEKVQDAISYFRGKENASEVGIKNVSVVKVDSSGNAGYSFSKNVFKDSNGYTAKVKLADGTEHEINITIPKENLYTIDLNNNKKFLTESEAINIVKDMIASAPIEHIKSCNYIRVNNETFFYNNQEKNLVSATAVRNNDKNNTSTIDFYPSGLGNDVNEIKRIFQHEFGHALCTKMFGTSEPPQSWKLAMAKDNEHISDYAKTQPAEDFAESIPAYMSGDKSFREKFPERAKVLDNLFSNSSNQIILREQTVELVKKLTGGKIDNLDKILSIKRSVSDNKSAIIVSSVGAMIIPAAIAELVLGVYYLEKIRNKQNNKPIESLGGGESPNLNKNPSVGSNSGAVKNNPIKRK